MTSHSAHGDVHGIGAGHEVPGGIADLPGRKALFVGRASQDTKDAARVHVTLDPSDLSLSRRHAQFRMTPQGLCVFDLGSKNGTYVKITAPFGFYDFNQQRCTEIEVECPAADS